MRRPEPGGCGRNGAGPNEVGEWMVRRMEDMGREMFKKALPSALVFIGKVLLSNISFS
jgi:hypothetical protein